MMKNTQKTMFSLDDLKAASTLTENVQQECIVTTYDKVKLVLIEYEENRRLALNWWNYLGMALSFSLPCFTSDFKDFLFFSADTLRALFIILSMICVCITIVSIIKRIKNRGKISIEYCANRIKKSDL